MHSKCTVACVRRPSNFFPASGFSFTKEFSTGERMGKGGLPVQCVQCVGGCSFFYLQGGMGKGIMKGPDNDQATVPVLPGTRPTRGLWSWDSASPRRRDLCVERCKTVPGALPCLAQIATPLNDVLRELICDVCCEL